MQRLWKYLSARKIALALSDPDKYDFPVSEDTVLRWKKDGKVDPRARDYLNDLLGVDIRKEAPRPAWAEGLEERIARAVATRLQDPKMKIALEELVQRAEETPPPSGGDHIEDASGVGRDGQDREGR